jgi:flavorubredoxin
MKIGIIVHSQTGNTLSVAKRLAENLSAAGHSATLEEVKVVGERKPGVGDFKLETLPNVEPYEALVFGAAVEAFALSPVMTSYLKRIASLEKKKVACLITQAFPYPWLGGNHAVRQMRRRCESKGATVCGSGIVSWKRSRREERIAAVADRLGKLLTSQ